MKKIFYAIFIIIILYVGLNIAEAGKSAMQKNIDRHNYALSIK